MQLRAVSEAFAHWDVQALGKITVYYVVVLVTSTRFSSEVINRRTTVNI